MVISRIDIINETRAFKQPPDICKFPEGVSGERIYSDDYNSLREQISESLNFAEGGDHGEEFSPAVDDIPPLSEKFPSVAPLCSSESQRNPPSGVLLAVS